MARYDGFRELATRLIKRNGRLVTYERKLESTPADPQKPWELTSDGANPPIAAILPSVIFPIMHKKIDGTTVRVTDKTAFLSAADLPASIELDVRPNDVVVDGSRRYVVEDAEDISPGEQKVLYILQLRG